MNTMLESNPGDDFLPENNKQNVMPRRPEPSEIFDSVEAKQYLQCDTPLTADYTIVAAEIALMCGKDGRLNGDTVAEVCFGPGNLCGELLAIGAAHVIGIDGSEIMVAHAEKKFEKKIRRGKMKFHLGTAQTLPLADNSMDGIVNFNSFHQFATTERAIEALREMVRVIKPGGWGFIRDFRRDSDPGQLEDRNTNPDIVKLLQESLPAAFTKQEFEEMLRGINNIGFMVIDAPNPWRLSEAVCERIRLDPVKHWKDAFVSQHVLFTKLQ